VFPVKTVHPTPGSGIWGKVERSGEGSEGRGEGKEWGLFILLIMR